MNRTALCVGINDYPGFNNDLSGCVNDALDWADLLRSQGYTADVLLDSGATKANLISRLATTVKTMKYRDKFVFTFSGHGTWIPDQDGDEIDGRDEALCCWDLHQGGYLSDDELHRIFSQAKHGTQITVISDSCHSGTVVRGLAAQLPQIGKPKFLSPGLIPAVPVTVEEAVRAEEKITRTNSRTGPVLLSGCDDPEYSYDANFGGRPNGAMSRVAIDTFPGAKSFTEWHNRIRGILPSPNYPQSPQLGATKYQSRRQPLT